MSDDAFTQSLVNRTNPSPYCQLIVLSEKMINSAFHTMWDIADDDSPLRSADVDVTNVGSLSGDLDAPSVSLNVTIANPQLYFFVTFADGTLTLDVTTNTWDVSGVNTLKKGDVGYDAYTKKMGVTEGDFTLAQLYIDASQATQLDSTRSSFGNEDWSKETNAVQTGFKKFVTEWLSQMAKDKSNVVGVALQTNDPSSVNKIAPSFPPTSLDHTMYPWLDPSSTSSTAADNSDSNALCYLMMTGNATPPSLAILPYSGTWVNDQDAHQGLLCIESSQFWGSWLLPLMQEVNATTQLYPLEPYAEAYSNGVVEVGAWLYIGYNPDHPNSSDSYFSFADNGNGTWSWWDGGLASYKEDCCNLGCWANKVKVWEDTKSASTISFDSGGQKISFTGVSTFKFTVEQYGTYSGLFTTASNFTITTNWHLNFALGVVNDGGLQITRVPDPDGTQACTSTGVSSSTVEWDIDWGTFTEDISDIINEAFEYNLGVVENGLLDALANQQKLFLPAGGTFLMKDAKFNSRGDLLITLHYNGDPPPKKYTKMPEYLAKLPARQARRPVIPRKKPELPFSARTSKRNIGEDKSVNKSLIPSDAV